MKLRYIFVLAFAAAVSATAQNSISLFQKDGTRLDFQVADLDSIVFNKADGSQTPVVPSQPQDSTQQQEQAPSITNADVEITKAEGWFESAMAQWTPVSGADGYNVYYMAGNDGNYIKADGMLVRSYGSYIRVDIPGLPAGNYVLKVVATKGGKEVGDGSTVKLQTKAFERQGFCFTKNSPAGGQNIGAYNDDGSLKDGAVVIYVTEQNKTTVSMDVVTSAKGTTTHCVGIDAITVALQKGLDTRPIAFRIIGNITPSGIAGTLDSDAFMLKGKAGSPVQNVTIEGIGDDATLTGFGVRISNTQSIELRNFGIMLFSDDGLSIDVNNVNVWIHNIDIFYGAPGSAADQKKGDGSCDIKDDSKFVTVSYVHFWDSGKMSLCGMKSETGPNYISYDHNWFDHSDSRHPRIRTMSVHVWNNYFDGCAKYGVGCVLGGDAFVESNYYRATSKPMMIGGQGTDAKGEGTFSGEAGGMIKSYGNSFNELPSGFSFITQNDDATSFDAYDVKDRNDKVPSSVSCVLGGDTYNNFDTDASIMYQYTPDDPKGIPAKVTNNAGRMDQGDFKYTFSKAADPSYDIDQTLKDAITAYKSKLVKIFGE